VKFLSAFLFCQTTNEDFAFARFGVAGEINANLVGRLCQTPAGHRPE
jgi:hypothetical protein